MSPYKIALHPDNTLLGSGRRQSFAARWADRLHVGGHIVHSVDAYAPSFFDDIEGCDGFMWWFPQMPGRGTWAKKLILALDHARDIALFPNRHTIWHFDDKIAQSYLLRAAGLPTPSTWVFWRYEDAVQFCRTARYPLVMKLATGIMSKNVRLLHSASDARRWINRLFGPGRFALEHPLRTAAKDLFVHVRTAKTIARRPERRADLQTNYLFLQEFLPGNDFDTRITVIGNRAFGFRRRNRPGDFRASGSGRIEHDPGPIDRDAVLLAFDVARTIGSQSLAVDVLRRDGRPVLTEISYMYEAWAVAGCPGHWKLNRPNELEWVEGQMPPEDAILEDFLALVRDRSATGEKPHREP